MNYESITDLLRNDLLMGISFLFVFIGSFVFISSYNKEIGTQDLKSFIVSILVFICLISIPTLMWVTNAGIFVDRSGFTEDEMDAWREVQECKGLMCNILFGLNAIAGFVVYLISVKLFTRHNTNHKGLAYLASLFLFACSMGYLSAGNAIVSLKLMFT